MKKAVFKLCFSEYEFSGETWEDVVSQLCAYQDLECLCRQARRMGTEKDCQEIEKLEGFLSKYYASNLAREDVASLELELSIGSLQCLAATEEV